MAASLKVSELSALTTLDSADLLLVSDTSATTSKKVSFTNVETSISLARLGTRNVNSLSDIHLTGTPTNGQALTYNSANSRWENTVPADPVQVAALQSLTGVSNGDTHFGVFSGSWLSSGLNLKTALQHLETAVENKATLLGTTVNDVNLGTFTGSNHSFNISDNLTIKSAFQEVEDAFEALEERLLQSSLSTGFLYVDTFTGG